VLPLPRQAEIHREGLERLQHAAEYARDRAYRSSRAVPRPDRCRRRSWW
jgi:hypothetical protein